MGRAPDTERLDPALALRAGTFDPTALLLLRSLRRCFWPLLLISVAVAIAAGGGQDQDLGSTQDVVGAIGSPLAGVIIAIAIRFAAEWLGLPLAYPLARASRAAPPPGGTAWRSQWVAWTDQLQLTRAFRSLRWTSGVQAVAVDRLGATGDRFERADRLIGMLTPVGVIACVLAAVLV